MGYLSRVASRACAPLGSPSGASIAPVVASRSPLAQRDQLLNLAEFAGPSSQIEPIAPTASIAASRPMSNAAEPVAPIPPDAQFPRRESRLFERPRGGPSPARLDRWTQSVSFSRQSVAQTDPSRTRDRRALAEAGAATPRAQIAPPTPAPPAAGARSTEPMTPGSSDERPERPPPMDREQHARAVLPASNQRATSSREDAATRIEQAVAAARAWVSSEATLADHRKPLAPVVRAAAGRQKGPDPEVTEPAGLHIGVLKVEVVPPPAALPKRERRPAQRSRPATSPAFPRGAAIYGWRQR